MAKGKVFLIPTVLHSDEMALATIPPYVQNAVKDCQVFFVENERTTRRYFKKVWKEMVIDDYGWFTIDKAGDHIRAAFAKALKEGKNVGIVSEAGCPGIADPGQVLVEVAHGLHAEVKPLVGPSAVLLALMASGMNGQNFQFTGYLPIDSSERKKTIRDLESDSQKRNCTQIFIETPYRNNQLLSDILLSCQGETLLCVAADITAPAEFIQTKSIKEWKKSSPNLHKKPVIFLLYYKQK